MANPQVGVVKREKETASVGQVTSAKGNGQPRAERVQSGAEEIIQISSNAGN